MPSVWTPNFFKNHNSNLYQYFNVLEYNVFTRRRGKLFEETTFIDEASIKNVKRETHSWFGQDNSKLV